MCRPETPADVADLLDEPHERGVVARGLGRCYNDAAQNAGGRVLDTTGLRRVHEIDLQTGTITVDAGISLDEVMRFVVPRGWWVPVTPGTRYVTVGGAIASDVHGKNHHVDGTFCAHVRSFALRTGDGRTLHVTPEGSPDVFRATAGGMGLTGVVLAATFRLLPVETSLMRVDTERAADLDDLMARMSERDDDYRYSVAWIDVLARGRSMGRAVLTRADHATLDDLAPEQRRDPLAYDPHVRLAAPPWAPSSLLNGLTIRAFNELWFRKAPSSEQGALHTIPGFFHPLDGVRGWNRLYGRRGFLQHQFIVPFGAEDTVRRVMERLGEAGCASFLAVLKRYGDHQGLMSFPRPGWGLALDVPARVPDLANLLDDVDRLVVDAGGRNYAAKDSRMRPELLGDMYPALGRWREIREGLDPEHAIRSDLARRLRLVGN